MSLIIGSAAHFCICSECGTHGWIVTASGERSPNCVTKRYARDALTEMLELEVVTPEEAPETLRQINASTLPEKDEALEAIADLEMRVDAIEEILGNSMDESDEEDESNDLPSGCPNRRSLQ